MRPSRASGRLCCHCMGVTYGKVLEVIVKHRCHTVDQVTLHCQAGGGCRSCHPEIAELIQEAGVRERRGRLGAFLARLRPRRSR